MTDTSDEAVERLANQCREDGDRAHAQVGCSRYMRTLWTAESTLRALRRERDEARAKALKEAATMIEGEWRGEPGKVQYVHWPQFHTMPEACVSKRDTSVLVTQALAAAIRALATMEEKNDD